MLVVQGYCPKDEDQAQRFAQWLLELGGAKGHKLLLIEDTRVTNAEAVQALYRQSFDSVEVIPFVDHYNAWPESPNDVFATAARHIAEKNPQPWLFCEPDCVLVRPAAFDTLWAEYTAAGQPFMGAFLDVKGIAPHMSGNGIYPGEIIKFAGNTLIAGDLAFDMAGASQIVPEMHKTNLIFQHWRHPGFKTQSEVDEFLAKHPDCVLFHQDKSDSLIKLLRARKNFLRSASGESQSDKRTMGVTAGETAPTTDILIKSWPNDYGWLSYCLRSIDKFASGFRKLVVITPKVGEAGPNNLTWPATPKMLAMFQSVEVVESGDGYLFQQAIKANAHEFSDADYILHIDSDTVLTQPITPESFFHDGKPVWYMAPYSSLGDSVPWKPITEKFLGEPVEFEFMRRPPMLVPRALHKAAAGFCMVHHKMRMTDYILSQPNREFSEFNALGALAYSRAREDFHWIDTTKTEMSAPSAKQFWSHDGVEKHRAEIEQILSGGNAVTRLAGGKGSEGNSKPPAQNPSGIKQIPSGIWVLKWDSHISKWVEEKGQLQHDFQTLPIVLPEIPVGGLVVDVGANIGDSTGPFLERVGENGQVIAFEPNLDAFTCLERNCPEAVCSQVALGDKAGSSAITNLENAGANHLVGLGDIEIRTLDSFGLSRCDFIKIDVEGFELRVLKGAEATIAKYRPKMLIEINEVALNLQGTTQTEVLTWLVEHGYQFWPVNQPNLEQAGPQYDILCRSIANWKEGDASCLDRSMTTLAGSNAAPKSNPERAAELVPWRDRDETLAYIDWLASEAKRFCTAPRSTTTVRERFKQAGVIKKLR